MAASAGCILELPLAASSHSLGGRTRLRDVTRPPKEQSSRVADVTAGVTVTPAARP